MSSQNRIAIRSSLLFVTLLGVALLAGIAAHQVAYAEEIGLAAGSSTVTTVPGDDGDADNMQDQANTQPVFRYGWQNGRVYFDTKVTDKTLDITGDTYPDTIKITGSKPTSSSPYLNRIKIYINGKCKKTVSLNNIDRAGVFVITLKNNKPFLWVSTVQKNSKATQTLYQYKKGKLVKVMSNSDVAKKNTSNSYVSGVNASGNSIDFTYTFVTSVTGLTKATYTYKYKGGTLVRTSDTTKMIRYATESDGYFTKSKLTAAGKFTAYKKTDLETPAFTVKVDKKVQPLAISIKGNKLYYKIQYGSKTGWITCPKIKKESKHAPSTLFYETYGKVNLKTSIPEYSKDTYYKASDLQMYTDHSLFIARNEIWARASAGKTFSTPELKAYFKQKSWYPVKKARSFTDQEWANIKLIQSIEEGRGSLYV